MFVDVELGAVCDVFSSKRIFASEYTAEGVPFYRGKEVIEKALNSCVSTPLFISEERFEEIKNKFGTPQLNDVLLTSVGTIGIPWLVDEERFYFKDGNVSCLRANQEKLLPEYLYYWLNSSSAKKQIDAFQIGSTQKALTLETIKKFNIPLPSLETQTTIVKQLSALDRKIKLNKQINDYLEQICTEIFGNLVETEKANLNQMKLGDVCDCLLGGTPNRNKSEYWDGNIPWINSGAVNLFRITKPTEMITELGLNNSSTKLLPAKTTVIAITGATLGQVSLLEIDSCANQSVVGVVPNDDLPYEFIYPCIKDNIKKLIIHQTGGAQQHINNQNVKDLLISIPTPERMNEYLESVTHLYALISKNCFENNYLTELRDCLLPKLLSGEIQLTK